MEKTKKVTKAQRLADIKALLTDENVEYGTEVSDAVAFINHELELLIRKNTSNNTKVKAKREQSILKSDIVTERKVAQPTKKMIAGQKIGHSIERESIGGAMVKALIDSYMLSSRG